MPACTEACRRPSSVVSSEGRALAKEVGEAWPVPAIWAGTCTAPRLGHGGPLSTALPHEGPGGGSPGEGSSRPADPSSLPQLSLEPPPPHIRDMGTPLPQPPQALSLDPCAWSAVTRMAALGRGDLACVGRESICRASRSEWPGIGLPGSG